MSIVFKTIFRISQCVIITEWQRIWLKSIKNRLYFLLYIASQQGPVPYPGREMCTPLSLAWPEPHRGVRFAHLGELISRPRWLPGPGETIGSRHWIACPRPRFRFQSLYSQSLWKCTKKVQLQEQANIITWKYIRIGYYYPSNEFQIHRA